MVSIGVVAHPKRKAVALNLGNQVQGLVSFDIKSLGTTWNHATTLEAVLDEAEDWCVILEDDAIPCPDFHDHLNRVLSETETPVVSLYLGSGKHAGHGVRIADKVEAMATEANDWLVTDELWHAVGYAVTVEVAQDILPFIRRTNKPVDEAITQWCKSQDVKVSYPLPSLVDHRDEAVVRNTPPSRVKRKALRWCGTL